MGLARSIPASGGVFLAAERWMPSGALRGQVVFVHGLGEHRRARPYLPFYDALAAHGFGVLAFDLRGHGVSQGARLYARDFAVLQDDLARLTVDLGRMQEHMSKLGAHLGNAQKQYTDAERALARFEAKLGAIGRAAEGRDAQQSLLPPEPGVEPL